jgi:hypothetical protein
MPASPPGPRHPKENSVPPRTPPNTACPAFRVLPDESQEEFDALAEQFRGEYQPQGEHQHLLIDQMIQARWRIARISRLEDAALARMLESGDPVDVHALATFQRYRTAAERSYYKAQTEMHIARQQRHENNAIVNMDNYMVRLMNAKSPRHETELRNEANSAANPPQPSAPPDWLSGSAVAKGVARPGA